MSNLSRDSRFLRLLRRRLSAEEVALLCADSEERSEEGYDAAIEAAQQRVPTLRERVDRNELRIRERYRDLVDLPRGRLRTLLDNSPPPMLAVLARALMRRSYQERLSDARSSLDHAELGLEAATALGRTAYFDREAQRDLEAEAWIYLGNARRINSDVAGAEQAFANARRHLERGTGDRGLKAAYLHEMAPLRFRQGRIAEAMELYDREIRLRRLLKEDKPLGRALVNRGIVSAWSSQDLDRALDYFAEGTHIVDDDDYQLLTLQAIAERLARDGEGLLAWKALCSAETGAILVQTDAHDLRFRWIKGITYRVLGEPLRACRELEAVRRHFISSGESFQAALVSLDLAAVRAGQGRTREVRKLAEEAFALFASTGLESRALAAFLVLHRAATAERLTEELAVRVANFLARHRYNRSLVFDDDRDS